MRISRPRDWEYMTTEQQQAWAEKTGKEVAEANEKINEIMKEMRDNPEKYNKTGSQLKIVRENSENRMQWFSGGKL